MRSSAGIANDGVTGTIRAAWRAPMWVSASGSGFLAGGWAGLCGYARCYDSARQTDCPHYAFAPEAGGLVRLAAWGESLGAGLDADLGIGLKSLRRTEMSFGFGAFIGARWSR